MSLTIIYIFSLLAYFYPKGTALAAEVSLTVDRGLSLVGPHCPGTVKLFCEGVGLTVLRWSYTRHQETYQTLKVFLRNDLVSNNSLNQNPAFLSVQLLNVEQSLDGSRSANFSSILTADSSQLSHQNVTSISCGDIDDIATKIVNITFYEMGFTGSLNITNVILNIVSGRLHSLEIQWMKLDVNCFEYELAIVYEIHLMGNSESETKFFINHTSCKILMCSLVIFWDMKILNSSEYAITLMARSLWTVYPITIATTKQYFVPLMNTTSCWTTVQCVQASGVNSEFGTCQLQYTTDHTNVSHQLKVPLNTTAYLPTLSLGVTYFLQFSIILNNGLTVNENITQELSLGTIGPDTPEILSLLGLYSGTGKLNYLNVGWTNLINACDNFRGSLIDYTLVINDEHETITSMQLGDAECSVSTCLKKIFTDKLTTLSNSINIGLSASNIAGRTFSRITEDIYRASAWYYRLITTLLNCTALEIGCVTFMTAQRTTGCMVEYFGDDSQYHKLKSSQILINDGTFDVISLQNSMPVHYMRITLNVSEILTVQEEIEYKASFCVSESAGNISNSTSKPTTGKIIGIAVGVAGAACCICAALSICTTILIFSKYKSKVTKQKRKPTPQQRSPSPEYEEINEIRHRLPVNIIELRQNEAYFKYSMT